MAKFRYFCSKAVRALNTALKVLGPCLVYCNHKSKDRNCNHKSKDETRYHSIESFICEREYESHTRRYPLPATIEGHDILKNPLKRHFGSDKKIIKIKIADISFSLLISICNTQVHPKGIRNSMPSSLQ